MYLINKKKGTEFTFKNRTFSPQQCVLYIWSRAMRLPVAAGH